MSILDESVVRTLSRSTYPPSSAEIVHILLNLLQYTNGLPGSRKRVIDALKSLNLHEETELKNSELYLLRGRELIMSAEMIGEITRDEMYYILLL